MEVDIPMKPMLDVEFIFTWVEENVFNKYIEKDYVINIITGLCRYEKSGYKTQKN